MEKINNTLKMGLILMLVCAIAAAALSGIYSLTKDRIDANKKSVLDEALSKVIVADEFKEKEGYYEAYKGGHLIGYAIKKTTKGYGGDIVLLVGVDELNKITGISIIEQQETPGLGARIIENEFLVQFKGRTIEQLELKKNGGEIDAITGATISSKAVTEGAKEIVDTCSDELNAGVTVITDEVIAGLG